MFAVANTEPGVIRCLAIIRSSEINLLTRRIEAIVLVQRRLWWSNYWGRF